MLGIAHEFTSMSGLHEETYSALEGNISYYFSEKYNIKTGISKYFSHKPKRFPFFIELYSNFKKNIYVSTKFQNYFPMPFTSQMALNNIESIYFQIYMNHILTKRFDYSLSLIYKNIISDIGFGSLYTIYNETWYRFFNSIKNLKLGIKTEIAFLSNNQGFENIFASKMFVYYLSSKYTVEKYFYDESKKLGVDIGFSVGGDFARNIIIGRLINVSLNTFYKWNYNNSISLYYEHYTEINSLSIQNGDTFFVKLLISI